MNKKSKKIAILVLCICIIMILSYFLIESCSQLGKFYRDIIAFSIRVYPNDYLLATIQDDEYSIDEIKLLLDVHDLINQQLKIYSNHDESLKKYSSEVNKLYETTQALYEISVNNGQNSEDAIRIRDNIKTMALNQINMYEELSNKLSHELEWFIKIKFSK